MKKRKKLILIIIILLISTLIYSGKKIIDKDNDIINHLTYDLFTEEINRDYFTFYFEENELNKKDNTWVITYKFVLVNNTDQIMSLDNVNYLLPKEIFELQSGNDRGTWLTTFKVIPGGEYGFSLNVPLRQQLNEDHRTVAEKYKDYLYISLDYDNQNYFYKLDASKLTGYSIPSYINDIGEKILKNDSDAESKGYKHIIHYEDKNMYDKYTSIESMLFNNGWELSKNISKINSIYTKDNNSIQLIAVKCEKHTVDQKGFYIVIREKINKN